MEVGSSRRTEYDPALGIRYAEELERCWRKFELRVGCSWRPDETYIKVRGKWMYFYRAVDERAELWNLT